MEKLMEEVKVLEQLDHPNIVKLLEWEPHATFTDEFGKQKEVFCIALEYANGGNIFDYVAQTDGFGEAASFHLFSQLVEALEYCQSMGISHRDLKPDNLLLDSDFNLKVTDFGLASQAAVNETNYGISS